MLAGGERSVWRVATLSQAKPSTAQPSPAPPNPAEPRATPPINPLVSSGRHAAQQAIRLVRCSLLLESLHPSVEGKHHVQECRAKLETTKALDVLVGAEAAEGDDGHRDAAQGVSHADAVDMIRRRMSLFDDAAATGTGSRPAATGSEKADGSRGNDSVAGDGSPEKPHHGGREGEGANGNTGAGVGSPSHTKRAFTSAGVAALAPLHQDMSHRGVRRSRVALVASGLCAVVAILAFIYLEVTGNLPADLAD